MKRSDLYQLSLIFLGVLTTALFAGFFYRELFPEYKKYQNRYIELEKFRSTYTGQPPPPFEAGIKQIVMEKPDKGPPEIDRCTSCHVALQFAHFSPTKIEVDINGNPVLDDNGLPVMTSNPEYVWGKLDEKIAELEKTNPLQAAVYKDWKAAQVGEHTFDMTKVLRMHPLIGAETRPFEYHPVEEYGCTSCHNGNGRGLTTLKAHGPVFDEQYEHEFMGPKPEFLEKDPENDPMFSKVFNYKPSHDLLFQTTPLYVGDLLESKCVQCHQTSGKTMDRIYETAGVLGERIEKQLEGVKNAYLYEKGALISLLEVRQTLKKEGLDKAVAEYTEKANDYSHPPDEREEANAQLYFLLHRTKGETEQVLKGIDEELLHMAGSRELRNKLILDAQKSGPSDAVEQMIAQTSGEEKGEGTLFVKLRAYREEKEKAETALQQEKNLIGRASKDRALSSYETEIDRLLQNFHRGEELFFSQACYACHRIDNLSRGGVGPELTNAGETYPWFLKESIVWPQADLKTSTMPNFKLDHEEVEDLVTFLLAQHGRTQAVSESAYKAALLDWEAGRKKPWEEPISPAKLHDLDYSMTVFATEGCASCHRLKGFESNVGYRVEKEKDPGSSARLEASEWYRDLIPEDILGTGIVQAIEENGSEIDSRIVDGVREGALLEKIESEHPGIIEAFYSNFAFANRVKDSTLEGKELELWKERVRKVLMMYVQEYGLGRLIGPRPNWSGIYRSDEWLVGHFRKPSRHIARSIMPVMPFDDSKYFALTYMLDKLAIKNRDALHAIWKEEGFSPQMTYQTLCSQCHGEYLHGNGPVSEWIYPIPKNLRNADFLRNYTRENVIYSIVHGIKGTPMPPWGEVAADKPTADGIPVLNREQIEQLVDWLFSSLLGGTVIQESEDVPKWQYDPEDVLQEMEMEGDQIEGGPQPDILRLYELEPDMGALNLPTGEEYAASLAPESAVRHKPEEKKEIEEVFNIVPNPDPGPEKFLYYIKKKYYTEKNIREGQEYFIRNCSVCHGKEGDGMGYRAGTMYDAKPRMLTNLHWLNMRDDLRLIRSIKYGVKGTSMTPWGDLTSSLQRLQLVIFIRASSIEQQHRDALIDTLYDVFDRADQALDLGRIEEAEAVAEVEKELGEVRRKRSKLLRRAEGNEEPSKEVISLYERELQLERRLEKREEAEALLNELKEELAKEKEIYNRLGVQVVNLFTFGDLFDKYLESLRIDNGNYAVVDGRLQVNFDPKKEKKIEQLREELLQEIDQKIDEKKLEKRKWEAKIPTEKIKKRIRELDQNINSYENLKKDLISGFKQAERSRKKQEKLLDKYRKMINPKTPAAGQNDTV